MKVIQTVKTPASGVTEVSDLSSAAGTARQYDTVIAVNDGAILTEWLNHGARRAALKGDGRQWFRVLSGTPTSPVLGDMWLQGGSGSVTLNFYDGVGIRSIPASDPSLGLVAATALLEGHAVRASSTGLAYASTVIDSAHKYRVIGVVAADILMGDAATLLKDGDVKAMPDWSLLTGSAALVENATYWLSDTPGRYTITPSASVASRIGIAISATQLLIQTGQVVLS